VLVGLGQTRLLLGHPDEARRLLAEALRRRSARYDPGQPTLAEAQALYAVARLHAGPPAAHAAEAERLLRTALPALAGGDPYRETGPIARLALARAVAARGRAVGPDSLRASVATVRDALGPRHGWTRYAARSLADLYDAAGRPDEARPYRALADAPPARRPTGG
jgi:hypothetical protein